MAICGPGRELTETVQRLGQAEPVADVAVQLEGLVVAGRSRGVVARELLHRAELIECVGQAAEVARVAAERQCPPQRSTGLSNAFCCQPAADW